MGPPRSLVYPAATISCKRCLPNWRVPRCPICGQAPGSQAIGSSEGPDACNSGLPLACAGPRGRRCRACAVVGWGADQCTGLMSSSDGAGRLNHPAAPAAQRGVMERVREERAVPRPVRRRGETVKGYLRGWPRCVVRALRQSAPRTAPAQRTAAARRASDRRRWPRTHCFGACHPQGTQLLALAR